MRSHSKLGERRGDSHKYIEDQELDMAKTVFDVVSEDPQKEHVAKEMEPTGMHEHRGEDRHRIGSGLCTKSCGDKCPFVDERSTPHWCGRW